MKQDRPPEQLLFSVADLREAADAGIIAEYDVEKLVRWASVRDVEARSTQVEHTKGFNLVTVAYYFGAMLMISACAWFLGDKWDSLGTVGVLVTSIVYFAIALALGLWLREKGYKVGGGLLVTVAVCLVPLITYSIEKLLGFWPDIDPGSYDEYYTHIRGGWIVIELVTMAAALVALLYVRVGFLTAPLAFSLWYFSMDAAAWILGRDSLHGNEAAWVSVGVGAVTIAAGYIIDRTIHRPGEPRHRGFCVLVLPVRADGVLGRIHVDEQRFGDQQVSLSTFEYRSGRPCSVFEAFGFSRLWCDGRLWIYRTSCVQSF